MRLRSKLMREAMMVRRSAWTGLAAAMLFQAIPAQSQTVPPGFRELELALTIARAGYECPVVERIEGNSSSEPGWESLRPEVAVCKNGRRFLVVTSGRRNAQPVVRPLPAAAAE